MDIIDGSGLWVTGKGGAATSVMHIRRGRKWHHSWVAMILLLLRAI